MVLKNTMKIKHGYSKKNSKEAFPDASFPTKMVFHAHIKQRRKMYVH